MERWIEYQPGLRLKGPPAIIKPVEGAETVVRDEPLKGWRFWCINEWGDELQSSVFVTQWPKREVMEATCELCDGDLISTHRCGIHAFTPERMFTDDLLVWWAREYLCGRAEGYNHSLTFGEVYLWGRIDYHEQGYRAQYAYPASLVNTIPAVPKLCELYGCKLIEADDFLKERISDEHRRLSKDRGASTDLAT